MGEESRLTRGAVRVYARERAHWRTALRALATIALVTWLGGCGSDNDVTVARDAARTIDEAASRIDAAAAAAEARLDAADTAPD